MPISNIAISWTLIFEWHVIKLGCKNRHPKDMCDKEIRFHAQNLLTIQGLTCNMIGGTYMTGCMISTRIFILIVKDIHMSSKNNDANRYGSDLDLLIISHSLHVSYSTECTRK